MKRDWDHVVVGGGSGGAVLAARLSEDPERQVLLLEAGGWDWSPYIHIPGFLANVVFSRSLNWQYAGQADASLGGRALTWMAGRVMGGSSSINGMVFGRGLPNDYDEWAAGGAAGWGWADMLPWFRKLEHWTGPVHATRGDQGPLAVRPFRDIHPACRAVMDAYVGAGVPYVEDYSVGITEGIGPTQATQRGGWRHSTARAYLKPARSRPNLTIATHARALKLTFDGRRCTGVVYARKGAVHTATASREVILAGGAFGSPKLLLSSGVGAADDLKAVGVDVVHDLGGVGRNLNDHVNVKLSSTVDIRTYNSERFGLAKFTNGLRFLWDRSGPAASPANHVQGFIKSEPGLAVADHQVQVMALGFNADVRDRTDGVSVVISPCHPKARGAVRLASADPLAAPRIDIALLGEPEDRALLVRACRQARDRLEAGPGRAFSGRVFAPAPQTSSDADWMAFFRDTAGLNWHPTSTCRMGVGANDVVDTELRVRGLEGLSIADASVMPSVPSGNTNAPTIAFAERASALIMERCS